MGASAARALKHDHHGHADGEVDFDGSHAADGIDALARTVVEAEAMKDGGGEGDTKNDAKPTPDSAPKDLAPVDKDAGKTVELGGETWVVGKGDSLWSIANATYGKGTYWNEIKKANKKHVHGAQNIIRDGDALTLPKLKVPTLTALKNFEDQPDQLRDLVCNMSEQDYQGFLKNTPRDKLEKSHELVMDVEMMRSSGMTMDELAGEQKEFLEQKGKEEGKSPGQYVHDLIESEGYGGAEATKWNAMGTAKRKQWEGRWRQAVKKVRSEAPDDVKQIIKDAEDKGGGFRWSPEDTEKSKGFAFTNTGQWTLHCGTRWVEAAEKDPTAVYGNIAHEMGGHNYYGDTRGWDIQSRALDQLGEEERDTATDTKNNPGSAYAYMETEIFAELYEFTYATTGNPTDIPFEVDAAGKDMTSERQRKTDEGKPWRVGDVKHNLARIKVAFAPTVADALVRGLWRKVQLDSRMLDKAKELFAADVKAVFGTELS